MIWRSVRRTTTRNLIELLFWIGFNIDYSFTTNLLLVLLYNFSSFKWWFLLLCTLFLQTVCWRILLKSSRFLARWNSGCWRNFIICDNSWLFVRKLIVNKYVLMRFIILMLNKFGWVASLDRSRSNWWFFIAHLIILSTRRHCGFVIFLFFYRLQFTPTSMILSSLFFLFRFILCFG